MEYIHFSAYLTKKKHRKDNPENNDWLPVRCVCMKWGGNFRGNWGERMIVNLNIVFE